MKAYVRRLMILTMVAGLSAPLVTITARPAIAQPEAPQSVPVANRGLPDFLSRWFPQFFGPEDTGPRPEETLQAPFADPNAVKQDKAEADALERSGVIFKSTDGHKYRTVTGEGGSSYALPEYDPDGTAEESGSLAVSHRRPDHLANWLMAATSEILTTDMQDYQNHLKHLATGMSETGLAEYQKFMDDSKIMAELKMQDVKMKGYVEEPPLLLNEGPLNGRYRWLFEMPVTVTFLPRTTNTYKDIDKPQENSLRFIVQTQIGRVEKGPSEDNVFIETWRVRSGEPPAKKTP